MRMQRSGETAVGYTATGLEGNRYNGILAETLGAFANFVLHERNSEVTKNFQGLRQCFHVNSRDRNNFDFNREANANLMFEFHIILLCGFWSDD